MLPGTESEVEHHRVRIVGRYAIGAGFMAGATLVTGRETFLEIFKQCVAGRDQRGTREARSPERSPEAVVREMNKRLEPSATAVTRAELCAAEQRYWLKEKPVGIMFTLGRPRGVRSRCRRSLPGARQRSAKSPARLRHAQRRSDTAAVTSIGRLPAGAHFLGASVFCPPSCSRSDFIFCCEPTGSCR
jgi:hypothetical protein